MTSELHHHFDAGASGAPVLRAALPTQRAAAASGPVSAAGRPMTNVR
ncbi:hypothetical protein HQN59_04760 [Schlegelella sp. ID0723]|uniref:Uncharacterized protein n=1 Tax=Piscinibacter koreensis TaxID=2742824 RepID=A0A7Y6NL07_9BURK|nr:hypothetical protein [Schlegelella koreensis]